MQVAQSQPRQLQDIGVAHLTEEFFMAALDLKQIDWAQIFLRAICILFPDNVKSMRLLAMYYEAL